ncbi:MAG: amidase [Myxococcota bacterium]
MTRRSLMVASLVALLNGCASSGRELIGPPAESAMHLAEAIRAGRTSAEKAVRAYLSRIEAWDDDGPRLQAVIALNPNAIRDARTLDREARMGRFRGPLHGVPILVKDNIETNEMPTTAGSLALLSNATGRDAPAVSRLRSKGAVILGKTNLSEWANFRSTRSVAGWSGVGGWTRNPHGLNRTACGSSSGSAVAVAARYAPVALGTETNGSIICPASMTGVVGLKPTVGLVSRTHVVPISPWMDTVGPMTTTVTDAALVLNAMAGSDPSDPVTEHADREKRDYLHGLANGIEGMRLGVCRWAQGDLPPVSAAFDSAVSTLAGLGAVMVDIRQFSPDPVLSERVDETMQTDFKDALNQYLRTSADTVTVRTLKQLILFNREQASRELALFGQDLFEAAIKRGPARVIRHSKNVDAIRRAAREGGIDRMLQENDVVALVMPSAPPPFVFDRAYLGHFPGSDVGATWLAAFAGYPVLSIPIPTTSIPIGLAVMSTAWEEKTLLAIGFAYEQARGEGVRPTFLRGPMDLPVLARALLPYSETSSRSEP